MSARVLIGALIALLLRAVAQAAPATAPDAGKIDVTYAVRVPLRDGVTLAATVYRPKGQDQPLPCVFTLTPYTRQTYHDRGVYFAAHGQPFLTVDVRGRGDSEGTFQSNVQEAHDGYDVVEWLARQPYCNGRISMWGGSYAGHDQWRTAKERPPHLVSIAPAAAPFFGLDFPVQNGMMAPYLLQWITFVAGRTSQAQIFGDDALWKELFLDHYLHDRPFRDLTHGLNIDQPLLREWIDHRDDAAYYVERDATDAELRALSLPILTITGAYDDDQPGALEWYRRTWALADTAQRARMFLVIGPWDHAGTRTPAAQVGGLTFGPASLLDLPKLNLDWYRWTLSGGDRPAFLKKRVAYYVAGADTWRYADSLDAVAAESRPFGLASEGRADDPLRSGDLRGRAAGGPDHYVYDPADTAPGVREASGSADYVTDATGVMAGVGRELVYHTAPFEADTEVSGFFRLRAWIALDQPDTDFDAAVYAVEPDGRSILLSRDRLRARYREGDFSPKLIRTRLPLAYDFSRFTFVSRRMQRGSRLRLVVGPVNSIFSEKNHNSGRPVEDEGPGDARPVTVTLFHDAAHPSTLYVPVASAAPD